MIEKTIEVLDDEHVLLTVTVMDGERIRSRRQYHLAKFAHQSAEEVCRQACPEAFAGDDTPAGGQ
jgi:hypothetical protein